MSEALYSDPRFVPLEAVGYTVPIDQGLPCGQLECTPLLENCVEKGTDAQQAVISCARYMAVQALQLEKVDLVEELESHKKLIRALSVDKKTGILTLNASDALFNRLAETGVLETMRDEGYVMKLTFGDLDKLKEHNTLGDHAGGDEAIATGVRALRNLYRREYDVVGVLDYEEEAQRAVLGSTEFSAVSRFAAGDELIVMSFIPPEEGNRRKVASPEDLKKEVARIVGAFEGIYAEYPPKRGIDIPRLHAKLAEEGFVFKLTPNGNILAPVSMTFATILSHVPRNQEEFEAIKVAADANMMSVKSQRRKVATRGAYASLIHDEHEE